MSDYHNDDDRSHRHGSTQTKTRDYAETDHLDPRSIGEGALVLASRNDSYYDDNDDDATIEHSHSSYNYPSSRRARSSSYLDRDSHYYGDDRDSYFRDDRDSFSRDDRDSYSRDDYSLASRPSRGGRHYHYDDDLHSSDDDDRPQRGRRESRVLEALKDLGLGGATTAGTARSRPRSQLGRGYSDSYYSRSQSRGKHKKWQHAATAAVVTGAIEAVYSHNEPGGWAGAKGQRVATSALGAAGIDCLLDNDSDSRSKRRIAESVVGGLGISYLANGPRGAGQHDDEDDDDDQSRSSSKSRPVSIIEKIRSRSRSVLGRGRSSSRGRTATTGTPGGLKEVAAIGGAVALGKAIYDRVRSKSRGRVLRDRGRARSVSSDYAPARRQRYRQRRGSGSPESLDDYYRRRDFEPAAAGQADADGDANMTNAMNNLEKRYKDARKGEIISTAFTTLATMNAFRGIYTSYNASKQRRALNAEGHLSSEVAQKLRRKNAWQDAAAVGIAALSLNSAYGEWKSMKGIRKEKQQLEERRTDHWGMDEQQQGQQQYHDPEESRPTYDNMNSYRP